MCLLGYIFCAVVGASDFGGSGRPGWVAGLIRDIPSVKELIDRIMVQAEGIIRQRLTGMINA